MKTLLQFRSWLFLFMLIVNSLLIFSSCSTDWFEDVDDIVDTNTGPSNEFGNGPKVNTEDPNEVSDHSSLNDGTDDGRQSSGAPPATTTNVQHPARIWGHQAKIEASPDQYIFLPFQFAVSSHADRITDIFVQISGANTYWKIEKRSGAYHGQIMLSVKIPSQLITPGEFAINYRIKDDLGIVSNVLESTVSVVEVANCSDLTLSGAAGLTVRSVDLGPNPGKVRVTYNTFTVPDRVDLFYGGKWVNGTGSAIAFGQPPSISNCSNPGPGFVGSSGFFDINHDPNTSRRLDIYICGCLDGGTQWDLWVECPQ